jgi:hypothetical protein
MSPMEEMVVVDALLWSVIGFEIGGIGGVVD